MTASEANALVDTLEAANGLEDGDVILYGSILEKLVKRYDSSGTYQDKYLTINDAIGDSSENDQIYATPGTYVEDVVVDVDNLTVTGAGADVTNIVGASIGVASPQDLTTTLLFDCDHSTVSGFTAWNFCNNGVKFNNGTSNNTLQNCIVTLNRNGIYMYSSYDNNVINNEIYNNRTGMQITYNITNTEIKNNIIRDNWTLGIIITYCAAGQDFSTLTVTGNTFDGNWYSEIYIKQRSGAESATGTLDVSANSFTDAPVTYTISADASLNEPSYADQNLGTGIVDGTATPPAEDYPTFRVVYNANVTLKYDPGKTLYVDATGTNTAAFTTIQDAISAASDGDTIIIAAGTYQINSTIAWNKSLTLIGAGNTNTIIDTGSMADDWVFQRASNADIDAVIVAEDIEFHRKVPSGYPAGT